MRLSDWDLLIGPIPLILTLLYKIISSLSLSDSVHLIHMDRHVRVREDALKRSQDQTSGPKTDYSLKQGMIQIQLGNVSPSC